MADETQLLSAEGLDQVVARVADAIDQRAGTEFAIVGIQRGGAAIAERLAELLQRARGAPLDLGYVDIAFYRDDVATGLPDPRVGPTNIGFSLEGRTVLVVDDVLQTGRTVRAAIDALSDYGRPKRVRLAALVDRGGRELPIAADFVGETLDVGAEMRVEVRLGEGIFAGARR